MQIKNIMISIKPGDMVIESDIIFNVKSKTKTIPKILKGIEKGLQSIKESANKEEHIEIKMNINDVKVSIPKVSDKP